MLVLLLVGFLAGLVTAVSPCVLPVLPILFAGGASGGTRRPYAIIGGLILSFTLFTLTAAWLLDALGLPQDFLRNAAIVLLFVVAATLLVPQLGLLVERPLARLSRRPSGDLGGGFVLGLSLGLVFVPCAGPVLAAITSLAASESFSATVVGMTLTYAAGAAVPMLAIALGGRRVAVAFRSRTALLRPALGVLIAGTALAIVFDVDRRFQTSVPGYTEFFQDKIERSGRAESALGDLTQGSGGAAAAAGEREAQVDDFGPAPDFTGVAGWLNSDPLSLAELRGKVVLVDFWTYSCINCLRTLPYLKAWDEKYREDGLVIVGVHTPEFAFEREADNVRRESGELGLRYAIALDNDYATWDAYSNRYWPAKYLIDRNGHLRYAHFGEGAYDDTEHVIQRLLGEPTGTTVHVKADAPTAGEPITPESYLGYERLDRYAGSPITPVLATEYSFPRAPLRRDQLAYGGRWRVEGERIVADVGARLRLRFHARDVHLVLGGRGPVEVLVDGRRRTTIAVDGHQLYTLLRLDRVRDGLLELRFAPGLQAYAFTFG